MTKAATRVAILDYGSGNLRSAQRALERVGASVEVTSDPREATESEALVVPGVGAFAACMQGLEAVKGPRIIGERLAGSRPVFGICVGMQVMFDRGLEFADGEHSGSAGVKGCGEWPGVVERLEAPVLPHMGWNTVEAAEQSVIFAGMPADERFYFVHSYGVRDWTMEPSDHLRAPDVTWASHGTRFVAAVENGPLTATQFHPEKSGDAGLQLLENWIRSLG
ncbi:imidazole glycerol phosphate synthase subunit HisH [Dietzia aerolata]|uniref:Imidazole glycerol phosphate synthase subunit HisH n=1 Tax=Dietzia aerolata TaxID=595984 RepID=A0ABV5JXW3_9ACTN|nr:imidazole glycerol phosphate synthase subunit HisH [Dietzia aerolata]MBB0968883.1 imidazole glycerol phosphate synthase subunit HisH [Dietzia aerolata]HIW67313.1 imidazole glycerol phosphate synthase subunit HisH [Candidatus Dietzia merdigallinarum]